MDRDKFDALVSRFLVFAAVVPRIEEYVAQKFPEGSYERMAFAKLKETVPDMKYFATKLIEAPIGPVEVSPEEHERIRKVLGAMKDARAILQETDFDVKLF